MAFKEISIKELNVNPVTMFSDGWAILTAGSENGFNGMTVSWGATGDLWGKAVAFAFVRPQRYTHEFCEKSDYFTLSFFAGKTVRSSHSSAGIRAETAISLLRPVLPQRQTAIMFTARRQKQYSSARKVQRQSFSLRTSSTVQ